VLHLVLEEIVEIMDVEVLVVIVQWDNSVTVSELANAHQIVTGEIVAMTDAVVLVEFAMVPTQFVVQVASVLVLLHVLEKCVGLMVVQALAVHVAVINLVQLKVNVFLHAETEFVIHPKRIL